MKKHEFRKGDKVICVNNSCVGEYLILNQIYVVERVYYKGIIGLVLMVFEKEFFAYRFELTEKRIIEYL